MRAYVGADWSTSSVVCATAVQNDKPRNILGAKPALASVRDLLERVHNRHPGAEEVVVILEAGSSGWVHLFQAAGASVHVVDAKQVKRYAESLSSSGAKADRRDARMLVELLRSPAHRTPEMKPTPELDALASLSAAREQCSKDHTRVIQQLRSLLREHMPLVDAEITIGTQWALKFLRQVPTPWHAADLDYATFERLTMRCRQTRRQKLWEALQSTEAPWLGEAQASVEALRVRGLLDRLEMLERQLGQLDEALDVAVESLGGREQFNSVSGIGLQMAVLLLVFAFGSEVPSHRDQAAVQMGAAPVFIGSGENRMGKPKGRAVMRRSASPRARRGTYMLGRLAQQNLGWAKAMYADARTRGQSAATAYRRITRSLLRILTAMVRNNKPYDDARYVAALKANGVSWAAAL